MVAHQAGMGGFRATLIALWVLQAVCVVECLPIWPVHHKQLPPWRHQTDEPWALHDFDVDDEAAVEAETRRLSDASDHDDVPTDTEPADADVEADWEHDFEILKPVIASRGYDTSGATRLCELPGVYCENGYRRRVPVYANVLQGDDWIGKQYQVILDVANESLPTPFHEELFSLRRATMLSIEVNNGTMPAGIENMPLLALTWIRGSGSAGLTGVLPAGFWNIKTQMFLLTGMPPDFTGSLGPETGMCDHLTYRFYAYSNPGMTGDIGTLNTCTGLSSVIAVYDVAVTGNAWEVVLNVPDCSIYAMFQSPLSGLIPSASVGVGETDPWEEWCKARTNTIDISVIQDVGGPLPRGLAACSDMFTVIYITGSNLTGDFPLDFVNATEMFPEGIEIAENQFTGQLPGIPPQTTTAVVHSNRWSSPIPDSWWQATGMTTLNLANCQIEGPLPAIPPFIVELDLSNNLFTGYLPDSWKNITGLQTLDLSNNLLEGSIFPWGLQGANPLEGANTEKFHEGWQDPPTWPLKSLTLSNNRMGISVGFMLAFLGLYQLEEIYASNCSLMGSVKLRDVNAEVPAVGGGSASFSGPVLNNLEILDLSENPDIIGFGYNQDGSESSSCWMSDWDTFLYSLTEISFSNNKGLLKLPNKVYSLSTLRIDGADSLETPEVMNGSAYCRFGAVDPLCDEGEVEACLVLVASYAATTGNRECGQLLVHLEDGSHPSVEIDETSFASESLCRCVAGYEWEEVGVSCAPCPVNTYRTLDQDVCTSCPTNSTTGTTEGAASISSCSCSAGFFMSNSICEPCPENTYSVVEGAVNMRVCTACTGGSVATGEGHDSSEACQCLPGATQASGVCVDCEIGRFKSWLGDDECLLCPTRSGYQLTTLTTESAEESECVCPVGTYEPLSHDACLPCPAGMECLIANSTEAAIFNDEYGSYPKATAGHMTLAEDPLRTYKCWVSSWCPGGAPGTCSNGRDPLAPGCGLCPEGAYTKPDGSCGPCSSSAPSLYLVLAILGVSLGAGLIAVVVNRPTAAEPKPLMTLVVATALSVTAVQNLGVLSSLAVDWTEPARSILKALSLLSFDLDIIQAECLIGQYPARSYGIRQAVAPIICIYVLGVIAVRARFVPTTRVMVEGVNAVGAIFQAFFISILLSVTLPFVCYSHPGNVSSSMVSNPSIMCFQNSQHYLMVVFGCLSFLCVAAPFLALVAYATLRYGQATADSGSAVRHLTLFRFLFFRYKPEAYYYGCISLARSCVICLLPVILRDAPAAQIEALAAAFCLVLLIQLYIQPWRSASANIVDAGLSSLMVMILTTAALVTSFDDASRVAGVTATTFLALMLILSFGAIANATHQLFVPAPFYHKFLCHHKAGAAGQARYLQMLITARLKELCFIDSDHLANLDDLLDIVRCRVGMMVIYLTRDTLRRPWCAGEVTTTFLTHRQATRLLTESFVTPSFDEIDPLKIRQYIHASDTNLEGLGIFPDGMSNAFDWLLRSDEVLQIGLSSELFGLAKFQQVLDDLAIGLKGRGSKKFMQGTGSNGYTSESSGAAQKDMTSAFSKNRLTGLEKESFAPEMLVISSNPESDEATAAVGIISARVTAALVEHFKQGICVLADLPPGKEDRASQVISSARLAIIVLSEGSLRSEVQMRQILAAVEVADFLQTMEVLPIFLPDFRFSNFQSVTSLQAVSSFSDPVQLVQSFFKRVAISLTTHGSEAVLSAQCEDITKRVLLNLSLRRAGSATRSFSVV